MSRVDRWDILAVVTAISQTSNNKVELSLVQVRQLIYPGRGNS